MEREWTDDAAAMVAQRASWFEAPQEKIGKLIKEWEKGGTVEGACRSRCDFSHCPFMYIHNTLHMRVQYRISVQPFYY